MREEQVTKRILKWLMDDGWEIVCFDFPQSGTGRFLHPNGSTSKNQDSINPDIVAVKKGICVFFENKDRFYLPDYEKTNKLITDNNYTDDISVLLRSFVVEKFYFGIGFPESAYTEKAKMANYLVDFVVGVSESGKISKLYLKENYDFFAIND